MIIRRSVRPRADYTMVSNVALRDRTLSFRARGILAYMLSLPDGSSTSTQQLAQRSLEGRDAVRTAVAELVTAAYLTRTKHRDLTGVWRWELTVYDRPQSVDNVTEPGPENPTTVNQAITTNKTSHIRVDDPSSELFTRASDCVDCNGAGYIETTTNDWARCACSGIGQP